MTLIQIGALIGGLGLFLLGMTMLTDGLKLAAGHSLRTILARWTDSRPRALAAGFLVTALVQSSGAVTVAAIGFVNAGLISFANAVWVVFGANVGTTMTAWIVALVGLNLKFAAVALPAVGLGVVLRLTGPGTRRAAYGDIVAGFGLFFLGISFLSDAFGGYVNGIGTLDGGPAGFLGNAAFVGIGFAVTTLVQSSSASIALALTASAGGMLPIEPAAAMVIGANLGSTTTGLIAVIGATPGAKRVAASHLLFNAMTGAVALGLLPVFVAAVALLGGPLDLPSHPAVFLSVFHTVFNVLGVLLMWPVSRRMTTWLAKRFVTQEEDEARLHFLDPTIAQVPALAAAGVVRELDRLAKMAGALLEKTVSAGAADAAFITRRAGVIETVTDAISRYLSGLYAGKLPSHLADALIHSARALQHYDEAAEITRYLSAETGGFAALPETLKARTRSYARIVGDVARLAGHEGMPDFDALSAANRQVKEDYRVLKDDLLGASARGDITVETLDIATRSIWHMRRAAVQLVKARRRIANLRAAMDNGAPLPAGSAGREPRSDAGDDLADAAGADAPKPPETA